MRKILTAAALIAATATAFAASNRPSGFSTICSTGESCSVGANTNVAFGAADQFVFKVLSGTFTCSVATFGSDPIPSKAVKECSINAAGGTPTQPPAPAPSGIALQASAGNGQVSLSWSYSGVTVGSQEVFRDTDPNPVGRVRIASVSQATRSFTATGLTNGVTYFFYIKNTVNGVVTNSNAASATPSGGGGGTPPPPPPPSAGAITGATCTSTGNMTINATVRITSGTFDGGCRTYNPGSGLGDGSQDEGQDPAFRVENGATLRNAILGNNGVDGVHFYNGGNLENFRWLNVGEDAFTIKSSGTVNISGVTGVNSEDKFGQVNAASTLNISNCIVDGAGKFIRQNGGTTFRVVITADRCQLSNLGEGVFRTDSSSSTARLTNSRLRNAGTLCIGPWASCTGSNNTTF
jgi:pectate lyase C